MLFYECSTFTQIQLHKQYTHRHGQRRSCTHTHTSNVIALSNQRMRTPLWLNKIMMSLCRVLKIIFHCQWFIASSSQMSLMVKRWTNVTALQTLSRVQIWRWPEHVWLCRRAATHAPHPVSVKSVQICQICVGSLVMKPWESPDDESAAAPAWNMELGDRGRSLCRGSHTWEVAPQEESQEHEEWAGERVNTSVCTRVRWRENTGDADARGVCCVCASEVVSLTSSSPEDAGAAQGWRCAASTWERAKRRRRGHTQLTAGRERRCEEEGFKRKNFEQQHEIHEKAEQFGDFDLCSWWKSF